MYASEFYSWLVFTLLIAGAIFLAVFVVLQWVKDAPKGSRVASVLKLYTLLYVLLLLLSLPFDSELLAPIAVVLGSGVGLGVMVGSVFSVVRGIIRWIKRRRAEEEQGLAEELQSQLAEAKDQSRIRGRNEEGKRPFAPHMAESQGRGTGSRCSVLSLLATRAAQSREAAAGQGAAAGTEAAAGRGATAGQRAEVVREAAAGAGRSDQKLLGAHARRGKAPREA